MLNSLGLSLIANVMNWDTDKATHEYGWLKLMSSVKYDGYSDFRAGVRFVESLATWLRQFDVGDREAAYNFVRSRLVYISAAEMQRVIENFVPEIVTPFLRKVVAEELGVKPYEVWSNPASADAFKSKLRRCLFLGLSDGSRIDILRRANSSRLSQEQIVPMMNISNDKWDDLKSKLCNEQGEDAKFDDVYLIDDFTASGTTFIRQVGGKWKGKLKKFNDIISKARDDLSNFPVAKQYRLHIHHYISSHQARAALEERICEAESNWADRTFGDVEITEGALLPSSLKLHAPADETILALCDRYYDDLLYRRLKPHCDEAGQSNMKLGYAECALLLVLEHNTPNNSIPILWAETTGEFGHPMYPLFRRRDRHG